MYFQLATKSLSLTSLESGSLMPVKPGLDQLDCIFNLCSLAAVVKSNCSDPFNENLIEQECSFAASSNEKGILATNASFRLVSPAGCGLKTILLLFQFTYKSSLMPFILSPTSKIRTA